MTPKTYQRLLQSGVLVSVLLILCVFRNLLFPYITSKQLPFNIIMEIMGAIWLVFILRYPEYRPKKSYISLGLAAYFLAILISCFVGVDFNLSFWGDAERMLGFFHLFHFLIFYFIIITVFRTWNDWRLLFQVFVGTALLVSMIGLFGENTFSTIGNTAYVSGYLIFSIYFIVLLFFRANNKAARWLYILPLIPILIEFWRMHTSGAIIGLGTSILLLFLLIGLTHANKKIRRGSLAVFVVAVLAIIWVFSQSGTAWFQNSFLRNLTSQKATFQTRLISWKGAAADFKYHPVFGTGFGNYAIIFDKHFTSDFYNYTTGDTYFDRAHNNIIDITSTTGLVGLASYLSIFIAVVYYLVREFKRNGRRVSSEPEGLNNIELIVIISLIAAYFVQNLAIFDSFTTLIGLICILGFIYWLDYRRGAGRAETEEERKPRLVIKDDNKELVWLLVFLAAALIFANHYNIKTWKMFTGSIGGYARIVSGQLEEGIAAYKDSLSGRPMERDARVTLINLLISNPELLSRSDKQVAQDALDYAISLAEKNVAYNPEDSMMQMQLAQILDTAARYNYYNKEKFLSYSDRAMEAINASLAASPERATTYFLKAQMQIVRGENAAAIATTEDGIALNPNYYEGYCRLAQTYFILEGSQYEQARDKAIDNCVDKGGENQISSETFLKVAINHYSDKKDYSRAVILAERLAVISGSDAEVWYNLAQIYAVIGSSTKAEEAFQKAYVLDPSLSQSWQNIKAVIEANRKK